ncbi:MAG: TRAP transporter substrate-binding protein [Spirochaetaceae bacterium]|nr:MAG: TRAP transporter substrate-binding protein [Spirochaetaceae bacterium]
MKRIILFSVSLLLVASMAWSAGRAEGSAAAPQQVVLRLAETHGPDYPTTLGNKEFARLVEERTNGRIRIEVYPSAQLGEERAVIEQVQFGAIDMTRVSISPLAAFAPQLDALQMPFLYRDKDHMWKVLRGEIGAEIMETLEGSGFVGLAWYDSGSRSFYTRRPVRTIADLRGMRIRVQESELMVGLVQGLGAVATPMPFGEVYSALQTGVIDGAENNWPSYYATSHFEVAPYFTLNHHTRVPEIIVASKIVMDRLSPADQEIIRQAAWDSMDYQISQWEAFEQEAEAAVRANGNTIIEIADNTPWQQAMQPLYARLSPANQRVVERIRAVR